MHMHADRPTLIRELVTKDKKNEELNLEVLHFGGLSGEKERRRRTKLLRKELRKVL